MSEKKIAVSVKNLGKSYRIWRDPSARLKAPLVEAFRRISNIGRKRTEAILDESSAGRIYNKTKYYHDFCALQGVDLTLYKGDSIGIIGRNGSGKSTLLQLIAGTLTPTDGEVETKGRVAALLELGAGFNDEFTGRENVYMNASILGLTSKEIDSRFERIAEFANIGDFMNQPIKTYSSGMRVRLAFAVQAEVNPDILIIDEALAVGDIRFTMKCIRRMKELVEHDTTLLFVSHDLSSIVNFCKEVIWIHDGQVFRRGDPKKVTLEYSNYMHYGELTHSKTEKISIGEMDKKRSELSLPDTDDGIAWEDVRACPSDGNGDAVFLQAAIESKDKTKNNLIFEGGEKIAFHLRLHSFTSLKNPIVCADIYDSKGNLVYGINSCLEGLDLSPFQENHDYLIEFGSILPKLRNGDYTVLFGLSDGSYMSHTHIFGIADCLHFQMKSTDLSQRHHMVKIDALTIKVSSIA